MADPGPHGKRHPNRCQGPVPDPIPDPVRLILRSPISASKDRRSQLRSSVRSGIRYRVSTFRSTECSGGSHVINKLMPSSSGDADARSLVRAWASEDDVKRQPSRSNPKQVAPGSAMLTLGVRALAWRMFASRLRSNRFTRTILQPNLNLSFQTNLYSYALALPSCLWCSCSGAARTPQHPAGIRNTRSVLRHGQQHEVLRSAAAFRGDGAMTHLEN